MKARELERLVETLLFSDLEKAGQALIDGQAVTMGLPGVSQEEYVGYLAAVRWIVEKIKKDKCDFRTAFEAYMEGIKGQ